MRDLANGLSGMADVLETVQEMRPKILSIVENLDVKKKVWQELDAIVALDRGDTARATAIARTFSTLRGSLRRAETQRAQTLAAIQRARTPEEPPCAACCLARSGLSMEPARWPPSA